MGRVYTAISTCRAGACLPIAPITDQHLGGLIIWIAGSFTIAIVFLIVFARLLDHEQRAAQAAAGARVANRALTQ